MIDELALTFYIIEGTMNGINPILADVTNYFSDTPVSLVMMVSTLVPFMAIPSGFLAGSLIHKVGYKKMYLFGIIVYLTGGLVPYFGISDLSILLVERGLVGIGYGILIPAGATIIVTFADKGRQGMLIGYGSVIGSISGVLYSFLSSVLLEKSIKAAFLVHALMVIPLLILICIPGSAFQERTEKDDGSKKYGQDEKNRIIKLGWKSWFWQIFAAVNTMFQYMFSLYISFVVARLGGNAKYSGILASISMIGGCFAGGMFGVILRKIKKNIVTVSAAASAVGFYLIFCARERWILCISALIIGFANRIFSNNLYIMLGEVTPAEKIATANANALALMNGAAFVAAPIFNFIIRQFCRQGSYQSVFIVGTVYFVIISIAFGRCGKQVEEE